MACSDPPVFNWPVPKVQAEGTKGCSERMALFSLQMDELNFSRISA